MKTIDAEQTGLGTSLDDAQQERIIITRAGRPVAVLVGVQDLDEEQLAICGSDDFWKMISERRQERTMSRTELEHLVGRAEGTLP
jgi:antitoxin (DNA-binding transcriptional repressor) of toxin-antitoxin stability system